MYGPTPEQLASQAAIQTIRSFLGAELGPRLLRHSC